MKSDRRIAAVRIAAVLVAAALATVACAPGTVEDPRDARVVTSDIPRFWEAFDLAAQSDDPASVFQQHYLDGGSPGLRDFLERRIGSAELLAEAVEAAPRYYGALRSVTEPLAADDEMQDRIHADFERVDALLPEARFVDVTLMFGRFNSAGTVGEHGLLLGLEFFGRADGIPVDELTGDQRAVLKPLDGLPYLVTHELAHSLQQQLGFTGEDQTLLTKAINEGGADFLASLVHGAPPSEPYFTYGLENEATLWAEFTTEMDGEDISRWLYQGKASGDRPADLGYFVGYRIVEAYYAAAADKGAALRSLLELADARAILEASGYAP